MIHYTPALVERASILTLEIGFDEFPDEVFGMVSNAFQEAAGVPVFLSASAYLLAAGAITKILSDVGSRLFDKSPVFRATVPLSFLRPGDIPPGADFRLVIGDDAEEALLREYSVGADGVLRNKENEPYRGDIPYLVISLDGRENEEYEAFAPTAASATLLERYFGLEERQERTLGPCSTPSRGDQSHLPPILEYRLLVRRPGFLLQLRDASEGQRAARHGLR